MKKSFVLLIALMAMTAMFTACGHDDEPDNNNDKQPEIQEVELVFFSRTYRGDIVTFLQNTGKVRLNYTDTTIMLTCDYYDSDAQRHTMVTPAMKMVYEYGSTFSFRDPESIDLWDGSYTHGMVEMNTGMVWFTFTNNYEHTVTNTYFHYPSPECIISNLENTDFDYIFDNKSSFLIAPDAECKTCIMQINNPVFDTSGTPEVEFVQYQGLKITPTREGYTITADKAESHYKDRYTITDVKILLSGQGWNINGSFKCNGYKINVAGGLFH